MRFGKTIGGRGQSVDCPEVMRWLQAYIDAEVPDAARARLIASHLDACGGCGLEAETFKELKKALYRMDPQVDVVRLQRLKNFALGLCEQNNPSDGG